MSEGEKLGTCDIDDGSGPHVNGPFCVNWREQLVQSTKVGNCDICGKKNSPLRPCGSHWHYACDNCKKFINLHEQEGGDVRSETVKIR